MQLHAGDRTGPLKHGQYTNDRSPTTESRPPDCGVLRDAHIYFLLAGGGGGSQ